MQPSQKCIDLVKQYEGFRAKAYLCPAGILTIGYGHTGRDVLPGMIITPQRAIELLFADLASAVALVNKFVLVKLTQGQFDALVSIFFNVGPGRKDVKDGLVSLKNGQPSTLLRKLNLGDYIGAAAEFPKWNRSGGVVLDGLTNRRQEEQRLFLS